MAESNSLREEKQEQVATDYRIEFDTNKMMGPYMVRESSTNVTQGRNGVNRVTLAEPTSARENEP